MKSCVIYEVLLAVTASQNSPLRVGNGFGLMRRADSRHNVTRILHYAFGTVSRSLREMIKLSLPSL